MDIIFEDIKRIPLVDKSKNLVNILHPYRTPYGSWVYDDPEIPVMGEAFVCGSSEVIDQLVGKETNSFTAAISAKPIPGYHARLNRLYDEEKKDGIEGWYQLDGTDMKHWLCNCVKDYFPDYPKYIYVLLSDLKN